MKLTVLVAKDREEALKIAEALKELGRIVMWPAEEIYPYPEEQTEDE